MKRKITIRDIAAEIKVHHTTVSRALNNDRRISKPTRQLVLQAAEALGYQPDPMLSALMSYRSDNSRRKVRASLAWVTNYPTRDGWHQFERRPYFRGANRRAAELGYTIEEFWLHEPGMTPQRATRILLTRNIQGLLFVPQPRSRAHLHLDWSKFSALSFGRTLARPILHNVDNDHYRSFSIAMRQIRRLGYRRPGFACWPRINESNDRAWAGAFSVFQNNDPQSQIPFFMHQPWTYAEFKSWVLKFKPDVVISHDDKVLTWMQEMGIKVPQGMGFVLAAKPEEMSLEISGIDESSELVGETAVNIISQMISRGERGIPETPISTFVEGRWITGRTLQRQSNIVAGSITLTGTKREDDPAIIGSDKKRSRGKAATRYPR